MEIKPERRELTISGINWIAHRGDPYCYPENSLEGFRSAIAAGANFIETDIHLTADAIPVLSHDERLVRIAGVDASLFELTWRQLQQIPASHEERFGKRFDAARIASLEQFVALLEKHPQVSAFIEIKRKSLFHFGTARCLEAILQHIKPVWSRVCLISFEAMAIADAMPSGSDNQELCRGWIIPEWSEQGRQQALALSPDYLFVNIKRLPCDKEPLWQGEWRWVLYNVDDLLTRDHYRSRGFHFFETNHIVSMLTEPDEPT